MKKIIFVLIIVILIIISVFGVNHYNEQKQLEIAQKEEEKEEQEMLEFLKDNIKMQVFIEDNISDKELEKIENEIRKIDLVSDVKFVSKEDALNQMKESFGEDNAQILDGYEGENNIFPASYIIQFEFDDLEDFDYEKIENEIYKIKNVSKISSSYNTLLQLYEDDMLEEYLEKHAEIKVD